MENCTPFLKMNFSKIIFDVLISILLVPRKIKRPDIVIYNNNFELSVD